MISKMSGWKLYRDEDMNSKVKEGCAGKWGDPCPALLPGPPTFCTSQAKDNDVQPLKGKAGLQWEAGAEVVRR